MIVVAALPTATESLSSSVKVSLTPTEKTRLAELAKRRKTSQSALGRQAILKALGGV